MAAARSTFRSRSLRFVVDSEVGTYIGRSQRWPEVMAELRPILLGCGLDESIKWAKPCYSRDGVNVAIMQEMKDFLALMFFKGALMSDPDGVLQDQGPNSRSARRMQFTSTAEVARSADILERYLREAIDIAASGRTVDPPPQLALAEELRERLDQDDDLRTAFEALTPGRRREYNLYISGAKKATTRVDRVDTCVPRIMGGKGLRDR